MITITSTRDAAGNLLSFFARNPLRRFEIQCDLTTMTYKGATGDAFPLAASTSAEIALLDDRELRDYVLSTWPALHSAVNVDVLQDLRDMGVSDAEQALRDMGVDPAQVAERGVSFVNAVQDEIRQRKLRGQAALREKRHPRYWFTFRRITNRTRGYFTNVGVAIADLRDGCLHTKFLPGSPVAGLDLARRLVRGFHEECATMSSQYVPDWEKVARLLRVLGATAYAHPNSEVQPGPILPISTRELPADQLRQTYWEQVSSRPSPHDPRLLGILYNAVGLGRGTRPYRNHYSPAADSPQMEDCLDLRALGLLASDAAGEVFHLTSAGYEEVLRTARIQNPPPLEDL